MIYRNDLRSRVNLYCEIKMWKPRYNHFPFGRKKYLQPINVVSCLAYDRSAAHQILIFGRSLAICVENNLNQTQIALKMIGLY